MAVSPVPLIMHDGQRLLQYQDAAGVENSSAQNSIEVVKVAHFKTRFGYQNQASEFGISKPKPRRNSSNTITNVNKMIPAKTPIMPVALMTRPMMISRSAIADLPPSPCLDGPIS